jgi:hypothetical protein
MECDTDQGYLHGRMVRSILAAENTQSLVATENSGLLLSPTTIMKESFSRIFKTDKGKSFTLKIRQNMKVSSKMENHTVKASLHGPTVQNILGSLREE